MKAEELRMGNYILYQKEHIIPCDLIDIELCEIDRDPIPLTEEILLKCGFVKGKMSNVFYLGDFEILLPTYFKYKDAHLIKIKHLHQLQNLYFALTGEELIIEM